MDTGDLNALLPSFLRRRSAPSRHQVVTEQVDRELITHRDTSFHGLFGDLSALKKEKEEEEKGDTRNRLNELATSAICGFGLFWTSIGAETYNTERRSTTLRQSVTDRDN